MGFEEKGIRLRDGKWQIISNDNRTEWCPIRSVIIRVIDMSCYQLISTVTISHQTKSFN